MKKTAPLIAGLVSAAALSLGGVAHADEDNTSGLYIGADYGYVKIDSEDSFDDSNDMLKGVVGYRFNPFIAIEGGYAYFGSYGNSLASAETDGFTAAVKGILPLGDRFELHGEVGQMWYSTDYDVVGFDGSKDDTGLFVGAGAGFKITDDFLINADYTWYDVDQDAQAVADGADTESDFNQVSAGVEYRF